jgi:hypothetical protein
LLLVNNGGIVGGLLGPESTRRAKDLSPMPFLGSFLVVAAMGVVAVVRAGAGAYASVAAAAR